MVQCSICGRHGHNARTCKHKGRSSSQAGRSADTHLDVQDVVQDAMEEPRIQKRKRVGAGSSMDGCFLFLLFAETVDVNKSYKSVFFCFYYLQKMCDNMIKHKLPPTHIPEVLHARAHPNARIFRALVQTHFRVACTAALA